jgi:hypothetical protein
MVAPIPTIERNVPVDVKSTPDFQGATEKLAQSTDTFGAIGAKVAQSASNQMATQLGYDAGKTPQGDLFPPVTDFDANFQESYNQQAHATLSLQGQKLLDDAQVNMSKATRLTPQLIATTGNQLQTGLTKIADIAPTAVKSKLQATFDSQVLDQTTRYKEKMISQQREDQKNTMTNGLDLNTKNAYELAANGDFKASQAAVDSSRKMSESAANSHFITPSEARIAHESAKQASYDGQYTYLAKQAFHAGQYEAFEKHYADNKPKDMTNEQYYATGQAFKQQISFIQGLRESEENLTAQKMDNRIALAPTLISGSEWKSYESSVSPLKYQQTLFKYIQAIKKSDTATMGVDTLVANFSNPESWALATPKVKNAAYLKNVDYAVQQSSAKGISLSHEEAEVQVATQAGGEVPVFVNEVKNKLHSGNPAMIESAAVQIHALQQMNGAHAIASLSDQDHAIYTMYESLRDSRDPQTAARDATAAILNQDPEVQEANKQKWSNHLKGIGIPLSQYALGIFKINPNSFINPSMAQVYGSDILEKYKSLYQIANGDDNVARKLTQKYIDDNYGETGVNGGTVKTMHPLEKVLGFASKDAVPYIQQDAINQINEHLAPIRKMYDDKKTNEYWEIKPLTGTKHGVFTTEYDPIQMTRHMRTDKGTLSDTYNVILQGNAFNWDVAVQTQDGMRNLFTKAPYLGVMSYTPNAKAIRESYMKDHQIGGAPLQKKSNPALDKFKDTMKKAPVVKGVESILGMNS